jgi:DNA (cytosine-5)-methyltransferase 1
MTAGRQNPGAACRSGPVLRYGSACSGIEAASVAWHHLGWQAVFFSEIEPFPRAVLAARWPGVPIHGDFTTIEAGDYEPIDLLVGGTPCQDFSVAGLRAGLAGERGFLTIEFVRLVERLRPRWLVWENVPGVLWSDDGRAFGLFLGALGECGYGTAWRVLDAQHFGVPQRRRRVFVVGYLGDWRPPAAVLFERESLRGDPAPRRAEGKRTPGGAEGSPDLCVAAPLGAGDGPRGSLNTGGNVGVAHSLRAEGFDASEDVNGRGVPLIAVDWNNSAGGPNSEDTFQTLSTRREPAVLTLAFDSHDLEYRQDGIANAILTPNGGRAGIGVGAIAFDTYNQTTSETVQTLRDPNGTFGDALPAVAFHQNVRSEVRITEVMGALNTGGGKPEQGYPAVAVIAENGSDIQIGNGQRAGHADNIASAMSVRRLTPVECARLQGFPDDYTLITYRKKPAADGPRYRALGNSMAVPCMRWIGERIAMVEELL